MAIISNQNSFDQIGLSTVAVGPDVFQCKGSAGTLWVTGTFTGSVQLESSRPGLGIFAPIAGTVVTAPSCINFPLNAYQDIRVNATVLSAGAADVRFSVR